MNVYTAIMHLLSESCSVDINSHIRFWQHRCRTRRTGTSWRCHADRCEGTCQLSTCNADWVVEKMLRLRRLSFTISLVT